ncbi:MBL fold metallo-hydrolase [Halomarina ordinaria]|uniref:MBL fold metallo-hydrolase n=1 Tax=Halomarina ordinaria TaxID=3033939 RepID=A0ABD5U8A4_9EURY|nr:MBL fold metallo-hydrolase [Halomarina sp. PSRA2]
MRAISLGNTAFEGLNNAYLLEGEVTTLLDTGVSTDETREQLRAGLADHGLGFEDIEQVLLTHFHADHAGLAGEIQEAGGAVVRVHEADRPLVEQDPDAEEALAARQQSLLDEWGMPADAQAELLDFLGNQHDISGRPATVETVEPGDIVLAGDRELEVVYLPGHTDGLCGYAFESDYRSFAGASGDELFSGDALLPYYTPNVGGADVRVERPLERYLGTLSTLVERDYARAWPGHRGPIVDVAGRAADIVVHHRERTDRVLDVLDAHGPADAWTVSAHLFGDLRYIHILHGPGEAYAHLGHLEAAGVVDRNGREYEVVDRDADLDALFPAIPDGLARPGPI